jgi:hypothetical protein
MFCKLMFVILFLSFSFARAEDKDLYVLCKNQKQVRSLRIQDTADHKGCEVIYTKDGVQKLQGSGQYFEGCLKVLNNIKANLEKGWWKCRDVTKTIQIVE